MYIVYTNVEHLEFLMHHQYIIGDFLQLLSLIGPCKGLVGHVEGLWDILRPHWGRAKSWGEGGLECLWNVLLPHFATIQSAHQALDMFTGSLRGLEVCRHPRPIAGLMVILWASSTFCSLPEVDCECIHQTMGHVEALWDFCTLPEANWGPAKARVCS